MGGWSASRFVLFALQQAGGSDLALPPGTSGFGVQLFRTVVALVGVCVGAWLVLRWIARRGYGASGVPRNLRVIERVALDARKSLYLVEAGSRVFLVGASDQSVNTLAELSRDDLVALPARPTGGEGHGTPLRFADVLARIRRSEGTSKTTPRSAPSTVDSVQANAEPESPATSAKNEASESTAD